MKLGLKVVSDSRVSIALVKLSWCDWRVASEHMPEIEPPKDISLGWGKGKQRARGFLILRDEFGVLLLNLTCSLIRIRIMD